MRHITREEIVEVLQSTNRHALLYGPRGTGKTTIGQRTRKLYEYDHEGNAFPEPVLQPLFSVSLTAEQSAASIIGHYVPENDKFSWHDGPGISAWRVGGLLIINEIDHASEDVSNCLHPLLDDFEVAQLTLPTNETVKPSPGFRVIATMNGLPSDLNDAVLDRFGIIMSVEQPSEAQLEKLSKPVRDMCRKFYGNAPTGGEPAVTYRQLLSFDELWPKMDYMKAAEACFVEKGSAQGLAEALTANQAETDFE